MAIIWTGTEDLDFHQGTLPSIDTDPQHFRSEFNIRCALEPQWRAANPCKSTQLPSFTTGWASCYGWGKVTLSGRAYLLAFGQFATVSIMTICSNTAGKVSLRLWDGIGETILASEPGTSLVTDKLLRYDIHVVDFGPSATVTVYIDGVSVITYHGSTLVGSMTAIDCVTFGPIDGVGAWYFSSFIVADEDTRSFELATLAPDSAGDTDEWSGTVSDINPITINRMTSNYTENNGDQQEYNLIDPPVSGSFSARAVQVSVWSCKTIESSVGNLKLGYKTNGSVWLGSSQPQILAFDSYYQINQVNPVTGLPWTYPELVALQSNMEAET